MLISLTFMACAFSIGAKDYKTDCFRSMTEVDLGALINHDELGIGFSHAIADNWTVSAGSTIRLKASEKNGGRSLLENNISFQYWPGETFRGLMLSFGISNSEKYGTKTMISLGYICRIWKGIGAGIRCRTYISRPAGPDPDKSDSLTMNVCYSF